MITLDKNNAESVIKALKCVAPANYDSMARIVNVVQYFEALLEYEEEKQKQEHKPEEKPTEEVIEDG